MHPSVRAAWVDYNKDLEGIVHGPYCDVDGWVTVGMGNKIDPVGAALGLPWVMLRSSLPATRDQIVAAWEAVKRDLECAKRGAAYALSKPENNIRLGSDAIDVLIGRRLDMNDAALKKRFPHFEEWPADAQLAAHSMVWAMGAWRLFSRFPKCCAALDKADFEAAATECAMTGGGGKPAAGTLITRNRLNAELFRNAAKVCESDSVDISALVWQQP